ncbi:DMT family transporter [Embleya sp. NBC_00896]|uniref:DMT family transporter n=1 Tax=Embleya sp. NBC_00896 TaxID=2975961 RepID=UPI00386453FE|nr:DMT family transporter [Embleya sp. NBC_00896]
MSDSRAVPPTAVDRKAVAAAGVTVVLWASAFVSIRSAGEHFAPGALALGRMFAGSVVLAVLLVIRREGLPPRAAWRGILVSGVLWFGLYMAVLNWGERKVDAGTAAMVVNVGPIAVALLAGWLLKEGFAPRLLAGIAVSFAGALVVGVSMSDGGGAPLLGVGLCVLAALSYAAGVVGQKPALRHASALQVTAYGCFIGTLCCLPFAGQLIEQAADAPLSSTLNVVYLGVFPTALGFTTWAYALARTTAGRMGSTTYAVPAVVVLLAWLFLREVPGPLTFVGGALCLAGVAVSRGGARRSIVRAQPITAPEPRSTV